MKMFSTILLSLLVVTLTAYARPKKIGSAKAPCAQVLSKKYYVPIFSTDIDILKAAKFAEGPAPQSNVVKTELQRQFRINDQSAAIVALKRRFLGRFENKVVQFMPEHEASVRQAVLEQFEIMLSELPTAYPSRYRRVENSLTFLPANTSLSLEQLKGERRTVEMLKMLAVMMPEDLIFMKKNPTSDEYELVAGVLIFPTGWSLDRFLGKSISAIHEDTTAADSKFTQMINRMIDRSFTTPNLIARNNWFFVTDPRMPMPNYLTTTFAGEGATKKNVLNTSFLRTERQTIRGLKNSGIAMFTIQVFVYRLSLVSQYADVCKQLIEGIEVKLKPEGLDDVEQYIYDALKAI